MSTTTARRILDTLLDPNTEICTKRKAEVRALVEQAALALNYTVEPGSDTERMLIDRLAAVEARWHLYA